MKIRLILQPIVADFPHRGSDLDAFLSIKPRIAFAEEFEEMLVLVGQIEDHEPLSWDIEHMNPNKVVKHPLCSGVRNASPFLVWEGRSMLLQGRADAIFERCIDEQTHRHHHQEGHNAFRLFEIEGGGQKLRGCEEAKPAFCPSLPLVSIEHGLGCSLVLVQFIRREKKTALLVDACLPVREPRRQSSCDMVDHLSRLSLRAWSPPLPIAWRGADGAVVEKRGLQVLGKMLQSLVGI